MMPAAGLTCRVVALANHPDQIPVLARLHQPQWQDVHPDMDVDAWEREFAAHRAEGLPATLLALDVDGHLLGSASLVPDDMEGTQPFSPWLANVLVLPAARGCGIGAALIEAIAGLARQQGHPTLYLFTSDRQDFYTQRGWRALQSSVHHGQSVVIMHRSLA